MIAHDSLNLADRDGRSTRLGECGLAYVDWVDISIVVAVHVAIGEKAVGEERKQNKLRECEQLIAGECETSATRFGISKHSVHKCEVDKP